MEETQSLFFKSNKVNSHWDTWMYYHESIYYLYYLIAGESTWEGFGVAISIDGANWKDHGCVLEASEKMVTFLGTGSIWKSVDFNKSKKFICNYSEWQIDEYGKDTQNILFAWSCDLINWTKYDDDTIFSIDTKWYEQYGRWDCIFALPKPGGGYYGTWTATPNGRGNLNGGIGFGYSEDGLKWQAVKPAEIIPDANESGAIVFKNGRYYGMFGSDGLKIVCYYADNFEGPYIKIERNSVILTMEYTYFSRFVVGSDELLVNHHAISRVKNNNSRTLCYFAPLKKVIFDDYGALWLKYWHGNDALKRNKIDICYGDTLKKCGFNINIITDKLNTNDGLIIEGIVTLPENNSEKHTIPGLYISHDDGNATCILIKDKGEIDCITLTDDNNFIQELSELRKWQFNKKAKLCVLLKELVLEVYLDDMYICSYSLPSYADGTIGKIGCEKISDLKIWSNK